MHALIGSTGFVGSTIAAQHDFSRQFNSRTIGDASGQRFSKVVCAAAPGSMFEANRLPEADDRRIDALIGDLARISAGQFILISTIAVFDRFDAGYDESATAFQTSLAYGRNRRRLEEFCIGHFDNVIVVRLPALFGAGLKKNFVFDIMNPMPSMLTVERLDELREHLPARLRPVLGDIYEQDERLGLMVIDRKALDESGLRTELDDAIAGHPLSSVNFTNPESCFQYYDMSRLWSDISIAEAAGLGIIHLAPEPLAAKDVYRALTGHDMPATSARVHREDMRTRHAALWGGTGPYIDTASNVLAGLRTFHGTENIRA